MKLSLKSIQAKENWAGYHLPSYDPAKIAENTALRPQWMHFGSGNIFRIFNFGSCKNYFVMHYGGSFHLYLSVFPAPTADT